MDDATLQALAVTLRLAATTTVVLLLLATPLAWWLAQRRSLLRHAANAALTLPLVLPPTVLGFYLLVLLGPHGAVGQALAALGLRPLVFTFGGLVVGSVLYSMPFALQPIVQAFEAMGRRPMEVAATLGARPSVAFLRVALPLARSALLRAAILVFGHTVGEFGVVLMVGGNIPGKTSVLSTEIFRHVEAMEYPQAHLLAAGMLLFSFVVLLSLALLDRRTGGTR